MTTKMTTKKEMETKLVFWSDDESDGGLVFVLDCLSAQELVC